MDLVQTIIQVIFFIAAIGLCISAGMYFLLFVVRIATILLYENSKERKLWHRKVGTLGRRFLIDPFVIPEEYRPLQLFVILSAVFFLMLLLASGLGLTVVNLLQHL